MKYYPFVHVNPLAIENIKSIYFNLFRNKHYATRKILSTSEKPSENDLKKKLIRIFYNISKIH